MKSPKKFCLLTNDVEKTSILNHKLRDKTALYLIEQGMPRLLELYSKYNAKATFFYTADIAREFPNLVKMVLPYGHEVGSHGLTHDVKQAFDILSYNDQVVHLKESKKILEDISGQEIISFRAPAARVSKNTSEAILESGFKIDSSISSQRLDMFFSFGSLKKLHWLLTPRKPYFVKENNIFKKGNSDLLEIPISALGFPYIGTFMRIAPWLNRMTRRMLYLETLITKRPFVFLTHPNEFIDEDKENQEIQRRASNYLSYLMGDVLRHRLKVHNLGCKAIPLFEQEMIFFTQKEFKFITCKEIYTLNINKNAS